MVNLPAVITVEHTGLTERASGGMEGAERTTRETALWSPAMGSPDQIINRVKAMGDARARDMNNNDGHTKGARAVHQDSIVGAQYRLNAIPVVHVLKTLGLSFDETWVKEFQQINEARFDLMAESEDCYLDATGMNTLTGQVRLAVGGFMITGEVASVPMYFDRDPRRPMATALKMISPARISNPNNEPDSATLKRGVVKDRNGKPRGYWVRKAYPGDFSDLDSYNWEYIPAAKRWGRTNFIHIIEQNEPGQSRGIGDIVAVLKNMKMTKTFSDLTLQSAVINATYASAIESDMPPDAVFAAMGGNSGAENFTNGMGAWMTMLSEYFGAANNVAIDGSRMPVLPPGTKINTQSLATPGGVGSDFGDSLLRNTAAALGMSYEEFSRNFSKSSYSALKGSFNTTNRFMKSRKKAVADRYANNAYQLVLEEEIGNKNLPMPRGWKPDMFYAPLIKQALSKAQWIGAGAGQIDELKETQAAILRIKSGLSTYEQETARLGGDWRDTFAQRAREEGLIAEYKLPLSLDTQKAGNKDPQNTLSDDPKKDQKKAKKAEKAARIEEDHGL